jgi:hypothetical protein
MSAVAEVSADWMRPDVGRIEPTESRVSLRKEQASEADSDPNHGARPGQHEAIVERENQFPCLRTNRRQLRVRT